MKRDTKAFLREAVLTGATLAFCAAMPFAGLHAAAAIVTAPPVASAVVVDKLAVPVRLEAAGEDPAEPERITLALEEQGYFRADVPLSYDLQDALHTACERYDIDYPIALGLIEVESNFQADAVGVDGHDIGFSRISSTLPGIATGFVNSICGTSPVACPPKRTSTTALPTCGSK